MDWLTFTVLVLRKVEPAILLMLTAQHDNVVASLPCVYEEREC